MNSQELVKKTKLQALEMHFTSQTSHIGSNFSVADILAVLYTDILKFDSQNPNSVDRDRVIYSKGHAATIYYALLVELGFIDRALLKNYGQGIQPLASHISHKVNGIEFSTGSLGHGLSIGTGIALALKNKLLNHKVFVIISDGELNEGSTWEAIMFAAHHQLNNLIVVLDRNGLQACDTPENIINLGDIACKLTAFNWLVHDIDGHNHEQLKQAFNTAYNNINLKPSFIIANTIKGKGVDFMENNIIWHYRSPQEEDIRKAREQLEME